MKAKEIAAEFIKNVPNIRDENQVTEHINKVSHTFLNDTKKLIKARNISTDDATVSLFIEMNRKFNALNTRLYNHYNVYIFKHNGYYDIIRIVFPNAMKKLKAQRPELYSKIFPKTQNQ